MFVIEPKKRKMITSEGLPALRHYPSLVGYPHHTVQDLVTI